MAESVLNKMGVKITDLVPRVQILQPRAIFGMNGEADHGIRLHSDGIHLMFPLGNKITVLNMTTYEQDFLSGHTNDVSCLDVSKDGKYVASGQRNHMGFRGYVILWNFSDRTEIARHDLHKVRVQSICFTANDKYVVSVGGLDDGNVIVFDMEARKTICRSIASNSTFGNATMVRGLWTQADYFLCAGKNHLRFWSIQRAQRKLNVCNVMVGKYFRNFTKICVESNDNTIYLGTMTGDIVKIILNCCDLENVTKPGHDSLMLGAFGYHNPRKPFGKDCDRFVNGVRDLHILKEGYPSVLLVGAGDGTIALIEQRKDVDINELKKYPAPTWPLYKLLKSIKVNGAISSLVPINKTNFYIGTTTNEIYTINTKTFELRLLMTCHKKKVNDIVFPKKLAGVFATAGYENIRVWSVSRRKELLRIMVYNFDCTGVVFAHDGTCILSCWNDGIIRAFTPITGRLIFSILNAHNKGCAAIAVTSDGKTLITGGVEGQVRIWKITPFSQSLVAVLKDHNAPVTSLDVNCKDTEVISSSEDGSCVIWDLKRLTRRIVIIANTQFMSAVYFPTSVQFLTTGTDGMIGYYATYNGGLIREIEASKKKAVHCLAMSASGDFFASVGRDQIVRLWDYTNGSVVCTGHEHASTINCVGYSPCGRIIATGATDGTVIIWDIPEKYWFKPKPDVEQLDESKKAEVKSVASKIDTGKPKESPPQENINAIGKVDLDDHKRKKTENCDAECNYLPHITVC